MITNIRVLHSLHGYGRVIQVDLNVVSASLNPQIPYCLVQGPSGRNHRFLYTATLNTLSLILPFHKLSDPCKRWHASNRSLYTPSDVR